MEGAWVNKHNKKYYLQYGAPGTEFSGYGDGVYVAENPWGHLCINRITLSHLNLGLQRRGHGATTGSVQTMVACFYDGCWVKIILNVELVSGPRNLI